MKLSKHFVQVKVLDDVYAIYNNLIMDVVFVTSEELKAVHNLEFCEDIMLQKGIYVEAEGKDEEALQVIRNQYLNEVCNLHIMYLIVTTNCNLGCKYCYIENNVCNNFREEYMSVETARLAIDRYVDHLHKVGLKKAEIILYGGEPLVNWKTVKDIVLYTKQFDVDIEVSIVTNGTLIDEEKIEFIIQNNVKIGISLDGPKEINDVNRVYRGNPASVYDRVMKSVQALNAKKAEFGLSITVSEQFLEHKAEIIEWLKKFPVNGIFYNLYHFSTFTENWLEMYEESSDFLIDSFNELNRYRGLIEGRQFRKFESVMEGKFKFSDCAAVGCNQITIRPNGNMSICHCYSKTDKYVIGNLYEMTFEEALESAEAKFWKYRSPIYNEECLKCEGLFLCGGGCPAQGEAMFGSRDEMDKPFCVHTKKSLDWLLRELYMNS